MKKKVEVVKKVTIDEMETLYPNKIVINNANEIEKYYNKKTDTYIVDNDMKFNCDIVINGNIKVEGNIFAVNIDARNINAYDIKADTIVANNINADSIYADSLQASNITGFLIKVDNI